MNAASALHRARTTAGLTLRELGARAATSHSTLIAYEHGRVHPTSDTFERIVQATGHAIDLHLEPRRRGSAQLAKGDELVAVLDLAAAFPARHSPELDAPVFQASVR